MKPARALRLLSIPLRAWTILWSKDLPSYGSVFDTFVLCSITGLVLGVTGVLDSGAPGNVLAINAFASVWEPLRYVVALSLLLFCVTTLMSQWYFGFVGLNFLFGRSAAEKFKYVFPCFCIVGALLEIELVWTIQDIALGLLTIPNLIAIVILWPKVREQTKDFFKKQKKEQ